MAAESLGTEVCSVCSRPDRPAGILGLRTRAREGLLHSECRLCWLTSEVGILARGCGSARTRATVADGLVVLHDLLRQDAEEAIRGRGHKRPRDGSGT